MSGPYTGFLVIRLTPEATRRAGLQVDDLRSAADAAALPDLTQVLDAFAVRTRRAVRSVSPLTVARIEEAAAQGGYSFEHSINSYWKVDARQWTDPSSLVRALSAADGVDLVYRQLRGGEPAIDPNLLPAVIRYAGDFYGRQGYLQTAPLGIDAVFAWPFDCGRGQKTGFVDIEQGWFVTLGPGIGVQHEDLPVPALYPGVPRETSTDPCPSSAHHGTAVLGIVSALDNGRGVVGIAPDVRMIEVASHRHDGEPGDVFDAILGVLDYLKTGDVLLLEYQDYYSRPAETDPLTKQAISAATSRGMIVIEPAGNLNVDLDTVQGLDRNAFDSGAIVVAGCKSVLDTSGTGHDRWVMTPADFILPGPVPPFLPDCGYSRVPPAMPGSNFGSRVDCYAWAEHVVTAGYGWLLGTNVTNCYTDRFSGTSAAGAIVAGAAVVLQSVATCHCGGPLTPAQLRDLLTATGTPRGQGGTEAIGTMPDLKRAIGALIPAPLAPTNIQIIS